MRKNKTKKIILKGMSLVAAGIVLVSGLSGCASKNNDETTQAASVSSVLENGDVLLQNKQGSYLQLLVTYYSHTGNWTYNVGYVTYDKNGVYFENINSGVNVKLSDEAVFDHNSTSFYYQRFSSLLDEDTLISGKVSSKKIDNILNSIDYAYIDRFDREAYVKSYDINVPLKRLYTNNLISDISYYDDEEALFSLDQNEPIKAK